jgi:hypothetical protein
MVPGSIPGGVTGFFSDIFPTAPWPWDRLSENEFQEIPGDKGGRCVRLTSWNPVGHTGPVMGLLYLYFAIVYYFVVDGKNKVRVSI